MIAEAPRPLPRRLRRRLRTDRVRRTWMLAWLGGPVIGIANGVQNTLMSTFIMQRVDPESRPFQMPAYVFILQCTVFAGFIGAAFIDVTAAGTALVISGVTAIIAGVVGALANRRSKQINIKEGIPI